MTQSLMSTDSKVLLNLPLCLSLRVPQHNSLSPTCAHDILLVTILTLPIAYQHIFSSLSCTLAPGSWEEGCKPLPHHKHLTLQTLNPVKTPPIF